MWYVIDKVVSIITLLYFFIHICMIFVGLMMLTGGPLHSTSRCPTSMGAVHKSVTCSCVFMLVQLNKCVVVCGSDLQRGHIGDGCLTSSILFKYERRWGHCLF